jgi:hypothetical protein
MAWRSGQINFPGRSSALVPMNARRRKAPDRLRAVRQAPPTPTELAFFDRLKSVVPDVQDWYHVDDDETLWMTASYDDMVNGVMATTWRVDFDGHELVGGRSPANMNWDDGVRARSTGMSTEPPDGFVAKVSSAKDAAQIAADWLDRVTEGRSST